MLSDSVNIIRIGLAKNTMRICFHPFFSSSMGAKKLASLVSFRSFCARLARITGACVSGKNRRGTKHTADAMPDTQNVHFQLTLDKNPAIMGANCGPIVMASRIVGSRITSYGRGCKDKHTARYIALAFLE